MIRYHFRSNIQMRKNSGQPVHRNPFFLSRTVHVPFSCNPLCLSQGLADLVATLAGRQASLGVEGGLGTLLDLLLGLGEDQLDVAGVGHVRVDLETISTRHGKSNSEKRTRPWAR